MKRPLINILIFVVLLAGLLIAGIHVSQAAVGSNPSTTLGTGVWTVNYDEDEDEDDTDPNEPAPEPEPEVFLG
jgi:hypothetical protein